MSPARPDTWRPEALDALTERERVIIDLHYGLTGEVSLTIAEVAERVGLTEARVATMLSHALDKLDGTTPPRKPALEPTPLSQLLRARREALGYSRPEVARRTGITESALDTYERGVKPRVDTAMVLARFYGISYQDLAEAVGVPQAPEGATVTPAQAISAARSTRGWTVDQMARELGATAHEVAAWERGDLEVTAGVLARVMVLPQRLPE